MAILDTLGFEPGTPEPDDTEVQLRACPYLELVRRHPDAMCGLHAGLIGGVLHAAGGTGDPVLDPFAAPGACVVRLPRPPEPADG